MSYAELVTQKIAETCEAHGLSHRETKFALSLFAYVSKETNKGLKWPSIATDLKAHSVMNRFVRDKVDEISRYSLRDLEKDWKGDVFIKEITLQNFGMPFYGKPLKMTFPREGTILLIGPNGSGKTTLVSFAPNFALYCGNRDLVNPRALREGKDTWVSLRVLVGGKDLCVKRLFSSGRQKSFNATLDGKSLGSNAESVVKRMLPHDIAALIWGLELPRELTERVKISELAKNLAMLDELETVQSVCGRLIRETTKERRMFLEKKNFLEQQRQEVDRLDEKIETMRKDIKKFETAIKNISKDLTQAQDEYNRLIEEQQKLQKLKLEQEKLKEKRRDLLSSINRIRESIADTHGVLAYDLVITELGMEEILKNLRQSNVYFQLGKLTGRIEDREESVDVGECRICKEGIEGGVIPKIEQEIADFENMKDGLHGPRVSFETEEFDAFETSGERCRELTGQLEQSLGDLKNIENSIEILEGEIQQGAKDEDITDKSAEIKHLEHRKDDLERQLTSIKRELEATIRKRKMKNEKIDLQIQQEQTAAKTADMELQEISKFKQIYESVRNELTGKTLRRLEERATKMFMETTNSPHIYDGIVVDGTATTREQIKLVTKPSDRVPQTERSGMSDGEKEVASLAVLLACKHEACKSSIVLSYPAVASLDNIHKENIQKLLGKGGGFSQLIIMATPSQAEEIRKSGYFNIAKEYRLSQADDDSLLSIVEEVT